MLVKTLLLILLTLHARNSGETPPGEAVERIREQAKAVLTLVRSRLAMDWLATADSLPSVQSRMVYRNEVTRTYCSPATVEKMPDEERKALKQVTLDEEFYYNTRYGSPIAYARPLEILGLAGLKSVTGKRVLDFGYGGIGPLRMLASLGADGTGVDVDTMLKALYREPGDTGSIRVPRRKTGRITLVEGQWPASEAARTEVGEKYDLVLSKNTLKRGYIHPERPVDKRFLVDLGVSDEEFVRALFRILKPGGRVLIYNLAPAPAPADKPYIPWADGRCPFPKSLWESAGFKVLAYDFNDDAAARAMGRAIGWDKGEGAMQLESDLFGTYTLVEKKKNRLD